MTDTGAAQATLSMPDDALAMLAWRLLPARQTHADRLRALLPSSLPRNVADEIRATPRLQRVLNAKLTETMPPYQSPGPAEPDGLADWEHRLIRLDVADTAAVVLLAGAVWHAATLKMMVMREALKEALAAIGHRAHALALRHADLTPVAASAIPPDGLRLTAERDGVLCLAAWADGLPPEPAGRVWLKLPPRHLETQPPTDIHRVHALPIVERCAQEVFEHGPIDDIDRA